MARAPALEDEGGAEAQAARKAAVKTAANRLRTEETGRDVIRQS
jgi:hypothetical protein